MSLIKILAICFLLLFPQQVAGNMIAGFPPVDTVDPEPEPEVFTEVHYVTQNGAGSKTGRSLANAWALSNFHNTSSNWSTSKAVDSKIGPGDVVYFSGTFTDRVLVSKGGSSAGSVTLDGYAAGDTNPVQSVNTSTALLQQGMDVSSTSAHIEYLTIQDFRMTDPYGFRATLRFASLDPYWTYKINRTITRRNYIYNSGERFLNFYYGNHNIIVDNKFYTFGLANDPANNKYVQGALVLIEFSNSIFARNEVGHDGTPIASAPGGSPELVHTHGCQYLLIEYNDLYGTPGQSGLRPKEHPSFRPMGYNNVIRFNKIHDNPGTTMGKGLYLHTRDIEPMSHFYIYGNYIYNNGLMGLAIGNGVSNVYAWANILSNNGRHGFFSYNTTGTSKNLYVYNNTITRNNKRNEPDVSRGGIVLTGGSQIHIKNNVFWNNRPGGETNRLQIASWITLSALEHNTYYHSTGTPHVYYSGGYRTIPTLQSSYGFENDSPLGVVRDPTFVDPDGSDSVHGTADDNYRLQAGSPEIGTAANISGSFSVNISGGDSWFETQSGYGTLTFSLTDALDPDNTDWTTNPPTVGIKTRPSGAWDRGAYQR